MRAAAITISTSRSAGECEDLSGEQLAALALRLGAVSVERDLVTDSCEEIEACLVHWVDEGCQLVLTSGGTGVAPSDRTPEATRSVIDLEIPGLGEAMRLASREHTPNWMLSRGVAGIRGKSLIVNLPGSPRSIEQIGTKILGPVQHALELIAGRTGGH